MLRRGQDLGQLPGETGVRPDGVGQANALVLGGRPGHLEPDLGGRALLGGTTEAAKQLGVGHGADVPIRDPGGEVGRLRGEPRHEDLGRRLGTGVEAGVLDGVVGAAVVGHLLTGPQRPDHLDGLLEHLEADGCRRPRVPEDVLVERLSAPDPQAEPVLAQQNRAGCRCLRDHCGWIRTVGQVTAVVTGRSHAWEIAPIIDQDERALALGARPGVVVVADHSASKPASSASRAWSRISWGEYSSQDRN